MSELNTARTRRAIVYALIAGYAAWLAVHFQPPILIDDAAITFRYVSRLVAGRGFTYNDREHVLGASNPLYVLLLAVLTLGRFDPDTVARVLSIVLFVIVALQAAVLAKRLSGSELGCLAGFLLPTDYFFRYQSLSGMESLFGVSLALAAALAMTWQKETLVGVFLGLAIWNKLDALLLAAAIVPAWFLVFRRIPARLVLTGAAIVAPWLLFAWWCFGSPVPHSLRVKLASGSAQLVGHRWIYDAFQTEHREAVVAMAGLGLLLLLWQPVASRAVGLSLAAWFLGHAAAFSIVDLGDTYPWYLTALFPPLIILICTIPGSVRRLGFPRLLSWSFAAAAFLLAGWTASVSAQATFARLKSDVPLESGEAFDSDRRLAGMFLAKFASPKEVVSSDFGWVAFETPNPIDDSLNSRTLLTPDYIVGHGTPYKTDSTPPAVPEGFIPLATFDLASQLFPGYTWFVVYGAPDSRIAREGPRRVLLHPLEWGPPSPFSSEPDLSPFSIEATAIATDRLSGATFTVPTFGQPASLVFSPSVQRDSARGSAAATFQVWQEGHPAFDRLVRASEVVEPVIVPLSKGTADDRVTFSLVTRPQREYASSTVWRAPRLMIGAADISIARLKDERLIAAWKALGPS